MTIYFDNRQADPVLSPQVKAMVHQVVEAGLEVLGEEGDLEVSISYVDDEEIRQLNRDYRQVDKVTDVLSFPLFETYPGQPKQLGDIVINIKQCQRQAQEFGHSFERELTYLTAHSLLHLYGYDHIEEEDKAKMRPLEEEILRHYGKKGGSQV
ncbi:MAG: rRNA maturation RNase YbeY [Tissierellia bacterium]|nr:rRNA maturation RNase YbeY [Tissierellia bacterium]